MRRVLIMGGTGVFGKRLARHLARFDGIELFVSSRSEAKAMQVVTELKSEVPALVAQGIALDHGKNLAVQLEAIRPFAVIDCSGPFQRSNYDAARTVLASGAHFIDLADARDHLAHFAASLDPAARTHGVCALTGASSTPTLSSCVVRDLTKEWQRIDTIDICITPGGKSDVGHAVIEAILSYAGKPVPIWQNGALGATTGWTGARKVHIPKLGHRRVAPVETYDAEYLGPLHGVRGRVSFAAGLESRIEQRGLEAMAFLRKHRLFPDPVRFIPLLLKARRITRIPTSDAGGMVVDISGLDASGVAVQSRWSLIARNDHGPYIPVMPAAAALKNLLDGDLPAGAYLAERHVTLDQILAQITAYNIETVTEIGKL